jgi:hypothetical protein
MEFEIKPLPHNRSTTLSPQEETALAAANWVKLNVDITFLENGVPIKETRSNAERMSPVDTYFWVLKQPKKLQLATRPGRKSGLVALSVYTHGPEMGFHALGARGFVCFDCDTVIRNEALVHGQPYCCFHTVLYRCGKDQFAETDLNDLPGVVVRASGELVLLPPFEVELDRDLGHVARVTLEGPETLAPVEILHLPDGLRKIIRAAERQALAEKRQPKLRSGVLQELYTPVAEGARNNTLAQRAGYLLGVRKLTEEQTLEVLLDINQRFCQPPLGFCEVRNIARSIAKKHHRHG